MKPYYDDGAVTLYHGRCEDVLPTLDLTGSVHLITDPPYYGLREEDWDNQWTDDVHFLEWMGEWLDLAKPLLTPDASVWVFAAPRLAYEVEGVIRQRFRVLNSARWVKPSGDVSRRNAPEHLRRYLSQWEALIFAEQFDTQHAATDYAARKDVFRAVGDYLRQQREAARLDREALAVKLVIAGAYGSVGSARANISTQEIGAKMLSPIAYAAWTTAVELKPYDELRADYDAARGRFLAGRDTYAHLRRPFTLDRPRTDLFEYNAPPASPDRHPCAKPVDLLMHIIETTTRPGDTVLDPFAGSGAVLDAARRLHRKAIGIEMDERWCRAAVSRPSSLTLFGFGEDRPNPKCVCGARMWSAECSQRAHLHGPNPAVAAS